MVANDGAPNEAPLPLQRSLLRLRPWHVGPVQAGKQQRVQRAQQRGLPTGCEPVHGAPHGAPHACANTRMVRSRQPELLREITGPDIRLHAKGEQQRQVLSDAARPMPAEHARVQGFERQRHGRQRHERRMRRQRIICHERHSRALRRAEARPLLERVGALREERARQPELHRSLSGRSAQEAENQPVSTLLTQTVYYAMF